MTDRSLLRSRRFWVALMILTGLVLLRHSPYLITAGILLLAGLTYPRTLRPLTNYKFWITIGLLVLLVPVFTGSQDRTFLGVTYSSERLLQTILMSLRCISIFLLFQVLTTDLRSARISALFSRFGIKHFDTVYDLAQETTPQAKSIFRARYAMFQEAWRRNRAFASVLNLAVDILADFVMLADQLSARPTRKAAPNPNDLLKNGVIKQRPALIVVVGETGAGKSSWLRKLAQVLTSSGEKVDGLISEKIADGGDLWHQVIKRIATGETRPLNTMHRIETPIRVGRFSFYPESIAWGCEQLAAARTTEWLIVDEVGLLEFGGGGLLPALQTAVTGFSGCLVLSVRRSLVRQLETFLSTKLPAIQDLPRHMIYV